MNRLTWKTLCLLCLSFVVGATFSSRAGQLGTDATARLSSPKSERVPPLRMATFRCDVTVPLGEPLIWITPAVRIDDPQWAKGIVLDDGKARYVMCVLDWCGVCDGTELFLRNKIASAAQTDPLRVAVHCVHQHTAPYIDTDAFKLLESLPKPPLRTSEKFLNRVAGSLAEAVEKAVGQLEPFDHIGTGQAKVERVASGRRLHGADGKIVVRGSAGGKDPKLAAAPEDRIDPMLKTISFARGSRPLARLHYYACHPQTHQLDGVVSADFVGMAREAMEEKEKVAQIYFNGCGGDVTVGKYNDGSLEARNGLQQRLQAAMEAAISSTQWAPAERLEWRTFPLTLPPQDDPRYSAATCRERLNNPDKRGDDDLYRSAIVVAFSERSRPLHLSSLTIGKTHIIHLPGECLLEFQLYAQRLRPKEFVAVAAYGDLGTGYICPDQAIDEGGYEPTASRVGRGSEALLKKAIRDLLLADDVAGDKRP
ncbi:hypothetical protein FJY63_09470 [Candidatus Sumerlaeota bacterium]|nr:hypothetical protein [Candidatus Sumerlaeota bacterium]